ncbi:MAG: PhoH family protein, partial [Azoarcus sp.]|nr:PhoH family protein [Azoarcus sp.]
MMTVLELTLEPVDNARLARLCGALDENLGQIENALDIAIVRRGAHFTLQGRNARRGGAALRHFYALADHDLPL